MIPRIPRSLRPVVGTCIALAAVVAASPALAQSGDAVTTVPGGNGDLPSVATTIPLVPTSTGWDPADKVHVIVAVLVGIAVVLLVLAVTVLRVTRPVAPALEPLQLMSKREWSRSDPTTREVSLQQLHSLVAHDRARRGVPEFDPEPMAARRNGHRPAPVDPAPVDPAPDIEPSPVEAAVAVSPVGVSAVEAASLADVVDPYRRSIGDLGLADGPAEVDDADHIRTWLEAGQRQD